MASWELCERLTPVQAGAMGNCSECCLRNLDKTKFCEKMRCYDEISGNTVYWTMVNPGEYRQCLMGQLPVGMAEWYNARSCDDVKVVATMCIKRAHENEIQK